MSKSFTDVVQDLATPHFAQMKNACFALSTGESQ